MDWQVIVIIILIVMIFPLAIAGISAAPWIPTRKRDIKRIIDLADIKKGEKVYDLGCGDARVLIAAAKEKQAQCVGLELSWLQWLHARINVIANGVGKLVKIKLKSFYTEDLSMADVVFIFLLPKSFKKVQTKLNLEIKPGTRVLVAAWPMPDWDKYLVEKHKPNKEKDIALYLYKIKQ